MPDSDDRIVAAYGRRARRRDWFAYEDEAHLLRTQEKHRVMLRLLAAHGITNLEQAAVLDVGCGEGDGLVQLLAWGAASDRMAGIDLRRDAVASATARVPGADLRIGTATDLPWPDASFDLVMQQTAFSSMLDDEMRVVVAREIARVLRPGGAVVWYDFRVGNPRNSDVRGVRRDELSRLFPGFALDLRRATLLPLLARRLPSAGRHGIYTVLAAMRILSTHDVGLFRK